MSNNYYNYINKTLRAILQHQKHSKQDLINTINISEKQYELIKECKSNLDIHTIFKIMYYFDIECNLTKALSDISENLTSLLGASDTKIEELSTITDISVDNINKIINQRYNISLSEIYKISKVLKCSPFKIYEFEDLKYAHIKPEDITFEYDGPKKPRNKLRLEVIKNPYIIDGDTIKVNNEKFRLSAIDTPETIKKYDKWGTLAKEYLRMLLTISNEIVIEYQSDTKDRYNRSLVHIWIERNATLINVNYVLLKVGLATARYLDKEHLYYKEYLQANNYAKDNNLLIYGYKFLDPYWDYIKDSPLYSRYFIKVSDQFISFTKYDFSDYEIGEKVSYIRTLDDTKTLIKYLKKIGHKDITYHIKY